MVIAGALITVVSLIMAVTAVTIFVVSVGRPMLEMLTNETLQTPVDLQLTLRKGEHTVLEQTGEEVSDGSGTTRVPSDAPPITAKQVRVTDPDGNKVTTSDITSNARELTRSGEIYSGVVRFTAAEAGDYRVRITVPRGTTPKAVNVVVAPALGNGFRAAIIWLIIAFTGALGFLVGAIVVIIGVVRRRRGRTREPVTAWGPVPGM
jgi:hypothetical protein